ncbi:YihY/virulence factor BrkB family protein [Actinomadura rayongensis]|uniref:YihY family inner membrane protein n=1 Tax=Actinomadura rayongensis TaxID=1429076 RepID=A0A6I4WA83_9ACTN|nr:YihY/virulence factor BrkB family protein [Actinomadura rayongensis]MXQ67097.1 YihY family inner membrane protein [Actinomadura rayongensis]
MTAGTSRRAALRRAVTGYTRDGLPDRAAALTYYAVLSIFPGMLALVSLVGLAGTSTVQNMIDNVRRTAPAAIRPVLVDALTDLQGARAGATVAGLLGLAAAFWSASGYVGAFMRAANAVYSVEEGRPIYKTLPVRVGITFTTLVLLAASAVTVVVSGPLARRAGDALGLGSTAVKAWDIAKWPVLLLVVGFVFALLYWAAPNVRQKVRWVTPGVGLALALWLLASAVFAVYVANFGNYNKTYGSIAGVIVFLVWLWISNLALLLGAEFDAELERGRAIAAGRPPDEEPFAEPRDTRAFDGR